MPRRKKGAAAKQASPQPAKAAPKQQPQGAAPSQRKCRNKNYSGDSTSPARPAKVVDSSTLFPPPAAKTTPPKDALTALFESYAQELDSEWPVIAEEGLERLFNDMGVDPDSRTAMVLSWLCSAKELGVLTKEELSSGLARLSVSAGAGLRRLTEELQKKEKATVSKMVLTSADFKEFYLYCFNLCRESPDKKGIDKALATGMLKLVFGETAPHVRPFSEYLDQDDSVKVLNADVWNCFCEFSQTISLDLSNYDESEAWPCLIDQYVAHRHGNSDNSDVLVK